MHFHTLWMASQGDFVLETLNGYDAALYSLRRSINGKEERRLNLKSETHLQSGRLPNFTTFKHIFTITTRYFWVTTTALTWFLLLFCICGRIFWQRSYELHCHSSFVGPLDLHCQKLFCILHWRSQVLTIWDDHIKKDLFKNERKSK